MCAGCQDSDSNQRVSRRGLQTVCGLRENPDIKQTMQPNKIESTTNYDKFILKTGNRPVRNRVATLMAAMKNHNQLQEYPILVSGVNGHLEIADGQHRFTAAKALGLPIFYIRSREPVSIEQIAAANDIQKSWSLKDWLESWVARDGKDYLVLKRFCETFKLPVSVGLEVIGPAWGGSQLRIFKDGAFKVKDLKFGQLVGHVIGALRGHLPKSDLRLIRALVKVLRVPGVNMDRLIKKISKRGSAFPPQATWMKYVELIEEIYNERVGLNQRLSLVFQVDKMERIRRSEHSKKANQTRKETKHG
jgi:hypothetical protein